MLLLPLALQPASMKSEIGLGNNTAPIIMEVYSDYQCSHCKQFHDDILPSVIRDYVNTGKLYLIHRDFPLPRIAQALGAPRDPGRLSMFNVLFSMVVAYPPDPLFDLTANGTLRPIRGMRSSSAR